VVGALGCCTTYDRIGGLPGEGVSRWR
jgi:hypothetical protein